MNYRTAPVNRLKAEAESQRLVNFGPPPDNIFKLLRTQHGYTLKDLCERIYITKQSLIRLEQGTYESPLPAVLEWWARHTCRSTVCPSNAGYSNGIPIGELRIRDSYTEFQELTRRRHRNLFGGTITFDGVEWSTIETGNEHPFRILRARANFNVTETAKALCVPQATIEHFEKKFRTQQSVPKNIRAALITAGYHGSDLVSLNEAYQTYRKAHVQVLAVS